MQSPLLQRVLKPFADVRAQESRTALLMFAYAYLAMTSYNIIRPLTRSKIITELGAVNVPYVDMWTGIVIGFLMVGYVRLYGALPRRWALTLILVGMAACMVGFWATLGTGQRPTAIAFYLWGQILGILTISQFWTLANAVYDPRQAKRLFGFIGGGVFLGGATGSFITGLLVETLGVNTLLLSSAATLTACAALVSLIVGREQVAAELGPTAALEQKGVGFRKALTLLRQSRQVQVIVMVIVFGAVGSRLIEQQVNMASELFEGGGGETAIGSFLGLLSGYQSLVGFVFQVWLTPRIHRYLGIGFALILLPTGLGVTAGAIIAAQALWAPGAAQVVDRSIRYSVDKTTREVLFLPLPIELRQEVKPFIDVTVDRVAKGLVALMMLFLIQPWGLGLAWWQLSFISLGLTVVWYYGSGIARRQYVKGFRQSLERRDVEPEGLRLDVADLSTVETLLTELASPDDQHVLYAIEVLESLDKHNLITPLLLRHESPAVRARVLQTFAGVAPEVAGQWLVSIQKMFGDESPDVRAAAAQALANVRHEQVIDVLRPFLDDPDPRIATTAAVALARSGLSEDVGRSEALLTRLATLGGEGSAASRREAAAALGQIPGTRFRPLLVLLLDDPDPEVAAEAMRSVRGIGVAEPLFVPTLVSLLGHRTLKSSAREVLVGYGEEALDVLDYLLRDQDEDLWVRRHLPATVARISCQKSMDILVHALQERDGFLRFKVIAGIEKLHRDDPSLVVPREPIEALAIKEGLRYFNSLTLHYNLFERAKLSGESLLALALEQKMARGFDRVFRLLGLIHPAGDITAARHALEHGEGRIRASASEYLDNILSASIRKRLTGLFDDLPLEERVRLANVALKTRPRDVEDTLLRLINHEDQVIAAVAIALVEELKVWTLADDLEHILAHRTPGDSYVIDAASSTLAARQWAEGGGVRGREAMPAVQLVAQLHGIPLFASVSVDELFRIAELGRQTRFEPGRLLFQEGAVPERLQFLLDGAVTALTADGRSREIVPPFPLGLAPMLEGRQMPETVRTSKTASCLALDGAEMWTLIVDNTELVRGLFRLLAAAPDAAARCVLKGRPVTGLATWSSGRLTPVEKVLALQRVPVFANVAAEEMRHLASIAHEDVLDEGTPVCAEVGAPAIHVILAGSASLESLAGEPIATAEAGDVVGMYETLAGAWVGARAHVTDPGRVLRIDHDELFDLLGQRPVLLQQIFSALFSGTADRMAPAP